MSEALGLQSALAEGYLRKKEYKQAEEACRRALMSAPEDVSLRRFLVMSLLGQERWKAAVEEGKELAGRRPEDAEACRLLGECLLRAGRLGAARGSLRRAVRLDGEDRLGLALLARTDIAVSSTPAKGAKYDRDERSLYDEFGWPAEELELSQSTMTLDELDLEELDEFPSSLASLPVADPDTRELGPAAKSMELSDRSMQFLGELPVEERPPVELTDSAIHSVEDLEPPMALRDSAIQSIEDLAGPEGAAGDSYPGDAAEGELDDEEATREWDLSEHMPRPGPSAAVASPAPTSAGAGPAPLPERPGPATPVRAAPAPDTPREGGSPAPDTGTTEPGRMAHGPWMGALVALALLAVVGVGTAVHLKAGRATAERVEDVRRQVMGGSDADLLSAKATLDSLLADGAGEDVVAWMALVQAARSYEIAGPLGPAEAALKRAEVEAPQAAETCSAQGYLHLRAEEVAVARAALVACAERHPRDPWLRYLLGLSLVAGGDLAGAAPQFDAALEAGPGLVAAIVAKAELHGRSQRWEQARAALAQVAAPDHPQALLARARLALGSGAPTTEVDAALAGLRARGSALSSGRLAEAGLLGARRELGAGRIAEATLAFGEAARHLDGPPALDHPGLLREAVSVALDVWRTQEARTLLDRAVEAGAKASSVAVLRGRLHVLLGRPEEALEALQVAPVSDPRTHLVRARAHLARGHVPAARRSLLAAADRPSAAEVEAFVSYREGRSAEAIARLRSLVHGSAGAAVALGRILTEEGRIEEATRGLGEGLQRAPGHPGLLTALGAAQLRDGAPSAALKSFSAALEAFPEDARALGGRAASQLRSGDLAGARASLEMLMARDRPPGDALLVHAELLLEAREVKAARKALGRAQAAGASGLDFSRVSGLVALAEHRPGRAVEVLKAAAQESPRSATLRLALARAFIEAGNGREARNTLREVLRRDPEHPRARLLTGRAFLLDEYDVEAIRELGRAATSAKKRGETQLRRAEILAALALAHHYYGEYGKALVLLDDAESLGPGRADCHLVRGMTFEKLERPDRAAKEYEAAVGADPQMGEAHYRYGASLLARGGSRETAAAHLRRYLALAPSGRYRNDARRLLGER